MVIKCALIIFVIPEKPEIQYGSSFPRRRESSGFIKGRVLLLDSRLRGNDERES